MKHELAIIVLWLLAAVPTLLLIHEGRALTFLGPLFFLCTVGSIYIVRSAKKKDR